LCAQTVSGFEVIVVSDGASPGTAALVRRFRRRLDIAHYELARPKTEQRAGATRNFGARFSIGEILVFLDSDVVPDIDLIEAHISHYSPRFALLGYRRYLPYAHVRPFTPPLDYRSLHEHTVGDWRLEHYPRWRPRDLHLHFFGCNYSIPAPIFCELGGHDERFEGWGGEDTDIGYRIIRSGYEIIPLWGIGLVTHLNHPRRELPRHEQSWHANPSEPLCRNGGPLVRILG
jgi:glycosyltransferase involved in cell wall biosynthesis